MRGALRRPRRPVPAAGSRGLRPCRALLSALLILSVTPLSSCVGKAFFMSSNETILKANLTDRWLDGAKVAASAQALEGLGMGHIASVEAEVGDGCSYNNAPYYQRVSVTDDKGGTFCMTLDREGALGMVRKGGWSGEVAYLEWADKGPGFEAEDQNKRTIFEALESTEIDDKQAAQAAALLAGMASWPGDERITIGLIVDTAVEETKSNLPNADPTPAYRVTITD